MKSAHPSHGDVRRCTSAKPVYSSWPWRHLVSLTTCRMQQRPYAAVRENFTILHRFVQHSCVIHNHIDDSSPHLCNDAVSHKAAAVLNSIWHTRSVTKNTRLTSYCICPNCCSMWRKMSYIEQQVQTSRQLFSSIHHFDILGH